MRAITVTELGKLRSNGQWSRLYLAGLEAPAVVFAARVNQAFATAATKDSVLQVTYDTVTAGAYGDIVVGQTLWIGSAAGLCDVGQARIRKAATSTVLYIGTESEIDWDNNLYLTVVNEFGLWPRHSLWTNGVPYMDADVAYSNQHDEFAPIPVMGSDAVVDVVAYPVTVSFSAAESWVPGGTISSYLWGKSAGALSSTTASSTTLTISSYPSDGVIRVSCRVTSNDNVQTTAYRFVHVYDATHRPQAAQIASIEGSYDSGGWAFDVAMYTDVSTVRDRTPIILFAKDYYSGVLESIGQQSGRENIVCQGWVDGETIDWDAEAGMVRFTVKGPQFWLGKMPGFPPALTEQRSATGSWTGIPSLTVDRALWHLLHWHSTATTVLDVKLTGDTLYADTLEELPTESLWAQIKNIADRIVAVPGCDRFGRLFVEVEPQCVPVANRTWVEVMTITDADWTGSIKLTRRTVGAVAQLDLSGMAYTVPNASGLPFYSLSAGHTFTRYGSIESREKLLVASQAQSNALAGLIMGQRNNPLPNIELAFAGNNRMLDVFPRSFCNLAFDASTNLRGLEYDGRVIVRNISMQWDAENGSLSPTVTCEAESFPMLAVNGDPPAGTSPFPPAPPPPPPPPLPPTGGGGGGTTEKGPPFAAISTTNYGILYSLNFDKENPEWLFWNGGLSATQYEGTSVSRPGVRIMLRDAASGYWYILVHDSADAVVAADGDWRGCTHIFCSPGPGEDWVEVLYAGDTNVGAPERIDELGIMRTIYQYNSDARRIIALLVDSAGQLAAIGGTRGNMLLYYGNAGGMVEIPKAYGVNFELLAYFPEAALFEINSGTYYVVFSENNVFQTRSSGLATVGGIYQGSFFPNNDFGNLTDGNAPAEASVNRWGWMLPITGEKFLWGKGDLLLWGDGSDAWIWQEDDLPILPAPMTGQCYIARDATGAFMMGGGYGVIGQRSSDAGHTWSNVGLGGDGGMTVGFDRWGNCGDEEQWVSATVEKVLLTLDGGDTWINKQGNLAHVAPLCSIVHVFGWYQ